MPGIVGAVGPRAVQAVRSMQQVLKHRGGVRRFSQGKLANDTEYAVSALGDAQFNATSGSSGLSITVSDRYHSSYAQARIVDSRILLLDRDCIGSRPLFYGSNLKGSLCAFASERKALWSIGINRAQRVDPRTTVAIHGPRSIAFRPKKTLQQSTRNRAINNESRVVNDLRDLLKSVMNELTDEQMGVAFSGGVDSSLLCAFMANNTNNRYFAAGLPESHDLKSAQQAARLLRIDLQIIQLDACRVELLIPRVIETIESCNPLDLAIALPMYVLSEQTKAAGLRSIMTGQGADELFAGYSRYARLPVANNTGLRDALELDVRNIARDNLERDNLAAASHSIDIILPYLDPRVVRLGLTIDDALKLNSGINKYILRKVAEQLMPHELAYKPKKALQYGSGVTAVLRKLARENLPYSNRNSKGAVGIYLRSIAEERGITVTE
ncbi:MAG: asparagine synthase family protein [Halobacteriota archaeon]